MTYCPGKGSENLTREEIESVGFQWGDYDEVMSRYDLSKLKEGFNQLPDGKRSTTYRARPLACGRIGSVQ